MRFSTASVCLFIPMVSAQSAPAGDSLYNIQTTAEEWDFCGLDYTDNCPPTISIEQSACEAPLIVNGRVIDTVNGETREDNVVQIQVDYRSEYFGSIDRKSVQKWGAGLNSTDDVFSSSGFFTTWIVSGFNDTPTDFAPVGVGSTPCGTRAPRSEESGFFFLQALPENEGKEIVINEDGSLNVNFSLSTSVLQTGMVPDTAYVYKLIQAGAFSDDVRLSGNCEVVYCCYNPKCSRCGNILKEAASEFSCDSTYAEDLPDFQGGGGGQGQGGSASSSLTRALCFLVATLLIFVVG